MRTFTRTNEHLGQPCPLCPDLLADLTADEAGLSLLERIADQAAEETYPVEFCLPPGAGCKIDSMRDVFGMPYFMPKQGVATQGAADPMQLCICAKSEEENPADLLFAEPVLLTKEADRLAAGVAAAAKRALACFPTGGRLIGAMRYGSILGCTGPRLNTTDPDMDFIALFRPRQDEASFLATLREFLPDYTISYRGDEKALSAEGQWFWHRCPLNIKWHWAKTGDPLHLKADIYCLTVKRDERHASIRGKPSHDLEAWVDGSQYDFKDWQTCWHGSGEKVLLHNQVFRTPAAPEHSVLRRWQNCLYESHEDLWARTCQ